MPLSSLLTIPNILSWFLITGAIAFAVMGIDKAMARFGWGTRISEKTLWLTALAGGFIGIIVGAVAFHHKTSKAAFWPPVVLAVIFWMALVALIVTGHIPSALGSI